MPWIGGPIKELALEISTTVLFHPNAYIWQLCIKNVFWDISHKELISERVTVWKHLKRVLALSEKVENIANQRYMVKKIAPNKKCGFSGFYEIK